MMILASIAHTKRKRPLMTAITNGQRVCDVKNNTINIISHTPLKSNAE